VLFVHQVHHVAGKQIDAFEALYRDGWAGGLADGTDARLLWFLHQAHGTGPAYTAVTITAVASVAALADIDDRVRRGDLQKWAAEVDALRHGTLAKVLEPVEWSPLREVDLDSVAVSGVDHGSELPLFMEDTAWPHPGHLDRYLEKAGTLYVDTLRKGAEAGYNLLELVAAFTPFFGSGRTPEVVLWQRIGRPDMLTPLFNHEVPSEYDRPGTWMHDALEVRDKWESRLLRVARWSPLG
jgi:hypothetical protein